MPCRERTSPDGGVGIHRCQSQGRGCRVQASFELEREYMDELTRGPQVRWILFLLMLTTSTKTCSQKHACTLGSTFYPSPVMREKAEKNVSHVSVTWRTSVAMIVIVNSKRNVVGKRPCAYNVCNFLRIFGALVQFNNVIVCIWGNALPSHCRRDVICSAWSLR